MRILLSVLCFAIVMSGALPTYAKEESKATSAHVIAVVDVQTILNKSKPAKELQKQIKKTRDEYLKQIKKREDALRDQEKDIIDSREKLTKEELIAKQKKFETEYLSVQKYARENKKKLDSAFVKSMAEIERELFKIVEKGYTLVLRRQNVFLAANALDITEDAMKQLDKNIKDIKLHMD
jgi:Skp family chaperone for outer membrane proteins